MSPVESVTVSVNSIHDGYSWLGRTETAAGDARPRLNRVDVAVRRAVMHEQRPVERRRRQRAVFVVGGRSGEENRVADLPRHGRSRRRDDGVRRLVVDVDVDLRHRSTLSRSRHDQRGRVLARRGVRKRRIDGRRVGERAVAVEIPEVDERSRHPDQTMPTRRTGRRAATCPSVGVAGRRPPGAGSWRSRKSAGRGRCRGPRRRCRRPGRARGERRRRSFPNRM